MNELEYYNFGLARWVSLVEVTCTHPKLILNRFGVYTCEYCGAQMEVSK